MTPTKQTNREMYPLVERYLALQQTQKAFCAECDLPPTRFNYWPAKYRKQSNGGAFIEINPRRTPARTPFTFCTSALLVIFLTPATFQVTVCKKELFSCDSKFPASRAQALI